MNTAINRIKSNKAMKSFLLFFTMAFAASCVESLKITSDYDREVNFAAYKTYSIDKLTTTGSVNQLNTERIIKSIRSEMKKKGFTENMSSPHLLVHAATIVKDKISLSAYNNSYSYYRPYSFWRMPASGYATIQTSEYKDGTLIIDIADATTNKLVWEGTGYSEITKQPKDPDAAISKAVARIMEGFPAGTTK